MVISVSQAIKIANAKILISTVFNALLYTYMETAITLSKVNNALRRSNYLKENFLAISAKRSNEYNFLVLLSDSTNTKFKFTVTLVKDDKSDIDSSDNNPIKSNKYFKVEVIE